VTYDGLKGRQPLHGSAILAVGISPLWVALGLTYGGFYLAKMALDTVSGGL